MALQTETIIKLILLALVILGAGSCALLPKTRAAARVAAGPDSLGKIFIASGVIGIITGLAGLFAALLLGDRLFSLHIWELILIPFFLVHVWYYIIRKAGGGTKDYDEKQQQDLTRAAALAWAVMLPVMVVIFIQFQERLTSNLIWFPVFLFGSVLIYAAASLWYNR